MKILLTGCAGFIGSHVLDRLLADGHHVIGVDNFDPFYARSQKQKNLESAIGNHESQGSFDLVEGDLADETTYTKIKFLAEGLRKDESGDLRPEGGRKEDHPKPQVSALKSQVSGLNSQVSGLRSPPSGLNSHPSPSSAFDAVIHLAAKAGVRPSIQDPAAYQRANVIATQNLLEFARQENIPQFVFASSSSVYGVSPDVPWKESNPVLRPISPYASTKVSCELLGHVYSHLYGIRFLGLRLFTVYGPRQRPDLAIHKFVRLVEAGEPIPVFGDGSSRRDYTFVDDIVDGIVSAVEKSVASGPPLSPTEEPAAVLPAYEIINLGNDRTVTLSEMIETIEAVTGRKANIDRQPEQPGDVPQTWADITKAKELLGYNPSTTFKDGVEQFYKWWKSISEPF